MQKPRVCSRTQTQNTHTHTEQENTHGARTQNTHAYPRTVKLTGIHDKQRFRGKESANAGDPGLTPGSGRTPGGGNDSPLQYSCLGGPMVRGAWLATVHGAEKNRTQLRD